MDVTLNPELEEFAQSQVRDGRFASVSDVINAALWLLREGADLDGADFEELQRKLQAGIQQADRGELVDFDESLCDRIHQRGMKRLQEQREKERGHGAPSTDTSGRK